MSGDVCPPGWRHDVPMKCPCYEDWDKPYEPRVSVMRRVDRILSWFLRRFGRCVEDVTQ